MYYDIFDKREQQVKETISMIKMGCSNKEIYKKTDIDQNSLRTLRARYKNK